MAGLDSTAPVGTARDEINPGCFFRFSEFFVAATLSNVDFITFFVCDESDAFSLFLVNILLPPIVSFWAESFDGLGTIPPCVGSMAGGPVGSSLALVFG